MSLEPIPCTHCSNQPHVRLIEVFYTTLRKTGLHQMYRMECICGMIGKCRPDPASAVETWNEPWQALVGREYLTIAPPEVSGR